MAKAMGPRPGRPKPTLFDEEERRKTLKKAAEIRDEFRKKK